MQIGKLVKSSPQTLGGLAAKKGSEYLGVAGRSTVSKLKDGKSVSQVASEVSSELKDKFMNEPGIKQTAQLFEAANKQRTPTRVPTTSKVKGRGNSGSGGSSNNRGVSPDLSDYSQIAGFEIPNSSSNPSSFNSPLDTSLYENPFVYQGPPAANGVINARTIFNVILLDAFKSHNAEQILKDVYASYKQAVNANTNGGTAATNNILTYSNFEYYIKSIWKVQCYLVELMTRQAWAAESEYSNRVLRKHSNYVSSDTELIKIRNRMATTLATLSLPKEMINYSYWLFQVYRTNTHNIAVDQFFSTDLYATNLILKNDISQYVTGIEAELEVISNQVSVFPQLTAFFLYKSGGCFTSLRNVTTPCNQTVYDKAFNDLFQNMNGYYTINGTSSTVVPPLVTESYNSSVPGAFSCGLNELPVHVTETLASRWTLNHPVLWEPSTIYADDANRSFCSKYIFFETGNDPRGVNIRRRDNIANQVGDDFLQVEANSEATGFTYYLTPKGTQSFLYEPSLNAVHLAQRIFVTRLFS